MPQIVLRSRSNRLLIRNDTNQNWLLFGLSSANIQVILPPVTYTATALLYTDKVGNADKTEPQPQQGKNTKIKIPFLLKPG